MSDDAEAASSEIEAERALNGLAYVCAHLGEITDVLTDDNTGREGSTAFARLRSAVRHNEDIIGPLGDIHHALLRAGDALGIYGHVRGLHSLILAGVEQGRPLEIVYRCPAGRCPRIVPGPAVTPPRCDVVGQELRWGQL